MPPDHKNVLKEQTYFVKGMHCASCEVLIEKKLLELEGIKSVEASVAKDSVLIEYEGKKPTLPELNEIFKRENYIFFDTPIKEKKVVNKKYSLLTFGIALLIITGFIGLNKLGLSGLVNVNSSSSLPTFFLFGLLAGLSSCAALVGGIILSLSKQWSELHSDNLSFFQRIQPHFLFNVGRLISYAFFGTLLGALGNKLQLSLTFTSVLVIVVSLIMIFFGLQMVGLKAFRKFHFTAPRFITRYIANEKNFKGRYFPFLMGAATFFLPCGFTITTQGLALISGKSLQGGLIMLSFALGTLPILLIIGISSVKFSQRPHLSPRFLKIAGVLVLFFALYNINTKLNTLGTPSFSDVVIKKEQRFKTSEGGFAPIINGKQILKMEASSLGYKPNYFKVRVGVPVRWEIEDKGTSGCTNAIISKNLFEGEIKLTPGETSIKEFTPQKSGKYKFSCWMGMVSGVIEVVEKERLDKTSSTLLDKNNYSSIPRRTQGCSCGCGSIPDYR